MTSVATLRSGGTLQFEPADDSLRPEYLRYLFQKGASPGTPDLSKPCNQTACRLPDCLCSDTKIPGGMPVGGVPQMVVLSFQGAVNDQNYQLYRRLFDGRHNPNGCPVTGSFYVSHEWTNYYQVQSLYSQGHEIGDRAVTEGSQDYWSKATSATWAQQIKDQASILQQFGGVNASDVRGFRSPLLLMGGDEQMTGEQQANMKYDASRASLQYSYPQNPGYLWPYTYDYASIQDCVYGSCPMASYPGLWQVPLPVLRGKGGRACTTLQACLVDNQREAFFILLRAFQMHVLSDRVPLVLTIDTEWLMSDYKMAATMSFLDTILSFKNEVYVVSAWQAIQWTQQPTPISSLPHFAPWSCTDLPRPICDPSKVNVCYYDSNRRKLSGEVEGVVYRLHTCNVTCPRCYPWLGDAEGTSC